MPLASVVAIDATPRRETADATRDAIIVQVTDSNRRKQ